MKRKLLKVADIPELLKEWDFELNEQKPEDISHGSGEKIHWICDKGHKWVDTVAHRTGDHRSCPYCNNSKVWPGFNDLESQRPDLLKEWDYSNNDVKPNDIYVKSVKKVIWICPKCNNRYSMSPNSRVNGQNCPYCVRKRIKPGVNDLETMFPDVAKEWDYKKNEGLLPSEVAPFSNKKVWWICPNGHSYQSLINNKTGKKKVMCPVCTNKIVVPGINDLETKNPDVLKYWDYERNGDKLPSQFSAGSNKRMFWICDQGHSFKSRIYNMTHSLKGMNCPVCRNYEIVPGVNDLATKCPDLAKEWDSENNTLKITEVGTGTQKKAFWICKKGHRWQAVIASRALNKHGCPYCSNQKPIPGENDLGTLLPEILEYWDDEKNSTKPTDYAGKTSNRKVWLKCKYGHPSFKIRIGDFAKGQRCPYCSNKRIKAGVNDLGTTHAELASEWDYEKNEELTPQQVTYGSDFKVWWKCEKGHSWKAAISSRTAGRGCPKCLKEYQTSLIEKAFVFYLSKHFSDLQENVHLPGFGKRELDIFIPSFNVAIEYDGQQWHKNVKNDLAKDNLCKGHGITIIRIREEGCSFYESDSIKIKTQANRGNVLLLKDTINELFNLLNELFNLTIPMIENIENDVSAINESFYTFNKNNSLAAKCPKLCEEWNSEKNGTLTPEMISFGSNNKVWWKCEKGHEWQAVVQSRVRGNGCPFCSGKYVLKGFNDFASQHPELLKEWDYEQNKDIDPEKIFMNSKEEVSWKCEKGHTWKTRIATRTRAGSGCPICAGLGPEKGKNDLETLYPDLAKEWDFKKNGDLKPSDVLPGSEKKVWWICPRRHSFDTIVRIRTVLKCGCPVCNNLRVVMGVNDLGTLHPELIGEWNYEKNGDLLPSQVGGGGGSHKKIWWKCEKGHEWQATLSSRIRLHTGCPKCAIEKRKTK